VFDESKKSRFGQFQDVQNEKSEGDDWGEDDWGGAPVQKNIDLKKVDLRNKNLNELDNHDLALHKQAMDQDFNKNQLKPGDPGFVYDKVIDFT